MGTSRSRPWVGAAIAVLLALFGADLLTGPEVLVIALYGIAPLVAALGAGARPTAAVGVAALAAAALSRALTSDMAPANEAVFILAVAVVGALATGVAVVRARREAAVQRSGLLAAVGDLLAGPDPLAARLGAVEAAATRVLGGRCTIALGPPPADAPGSEELVAPLSARGEQLGTLTLAGRGPVGPDDRALAAELAHRCAVAADSARLIAEVEDAYAILDAIYARAPVGLALFDRELRYARINDRLAEINGLPAADHIGHRVSDVAPGVEGVEPCLLRVLATGRELTELETTGTRSGEFVVSYWPVRHRGDHEIVGVGCVVFEVTERRAAERALRAQTARYESLLLALSEVGEAMLVLEEGRLVYANPAFLAICGYSTEELRALDTIYDLVVESHRDRAIRRTQARLEGLVDPGYHLAIRHRDGHEVPMDVAGVPLELDGRTQMVVVARDVTARARAEAERERLLQRAAFLAEASAAFDEVLDEERTLAVLARLSVRELASTCVVMLGGSVGATRRIATVARDPDDERALRELAERYPFADRRDHPLLEVLATGESRLVRHPNGPEVPVQDERHAELIRGFDLKSTVLVPLSARGRTLGVMALGFAEVVGEDHVTLFEDLGRRAALAMDNARLYQERAKVARTLQRSLLPPVLPEVPGMELAARYVAAEGNEVGGDFYDCFPTRDGEWALVIGDVCGKGAEAAAVTALARYTVRASATLHCDRPEVVLCDLNDAIRRESPRSRFCTVLYVALKRTGDRVTGRVATGGHPLPLILRADGRVETAGTPGTLLGILPEPEINTEDITLRPGDAIVLYTDGVTEATPLDDRYGPEPLARTVAECAGSAAVAIAHRIERDVLAVQSGRVRDDVAIVVMRVGPAVGVPFVPAEPGVAAST